MTAGHPDPTGLKTTDLAHVRRVRRNINAYVAEEMHKLGADTMLLAKQGAQLSGLEFFEQWLRPEIPPPPPFGVLLGMEWIDIRRGHVVLSFEPEAWMLNPLGVIHGGIVATALDTTVAGAIHTTLPAGTGYATTDLHIRYLRATNADTRRLIATGKVIHAGSRHATAEGRIESEKTGKLIATATTGCAIIKAS